MDGFYIKPNSLLKLQNKVRKIKVTPPPPAQDDSGEAF